MQKVGKKFGGSEQVVRPVMHELLGPHVAASTGLEANKPNANALLATTAAAASWIFRLMFMGLPLN